MAEVTKPIALDETLQATNTALGLLGKDTTLQSIVTALAGIGVNTVGNLASLVTTDKTSLVGAVNELAGDISDLDTDKADKVDSAIAGNLASLDGNGNLADSGWKSDKTTTAVSGNPISISGLKSNQLAKDPIITFEPIQAGSGTPSPSNVRAISGYDKIEVLSCGKNLFDKDKAISGYRLNERGEPITETGFALSQWINVKPNTYYYRNIEIDISRTICLYDKNKTFIQRLSGDIYSFTTTSNTYYIRTSVNINQLDTVQLEEGESATTYVPYHKTTDLSESIGQTVYGGNLDVRSGIFTKIWGYIASYAGETLPSEWISDRDEYVSGTTPTMGAEVAYKLASANYTTIQLTPHEISLLKDYAYVSTNGTSIALDYHNGELASLGDVEVLGNIINNLGISRVIYTFDSAVTIAAQDAVGYDIDSMIPSGYRPISIVFDRYASQSNTIMPWLIRQNAKWYAYLYNYYTTAVSIQPRLFIYCIKD